MSTNKTMPTEVSVETFLQGVDENRRNEAYTLLSLMQKISGKPAVMWGPSIIGFGTVHYKYASGHEGDMPLLAFSPRKAKLTIYFEGFDNYSEERKKLGKHTVSKVCLYINKLSDINLDVLQTMLERSFAFVSKHSE